MAGGTHVPMGVKKERADQYEGRVTLFVLFACCVAAVGGSIFGYDIGISGGVTSMDPFLEKFFPVVYRKKNNEKQNNYCKYAPVLFQSMGFGGNASLYSSVMTGAVLALSTLVSIFTVDKWGRRALLIGGGIQMVLCQITVAVILGVKFSDDKQLSKEFSIAVVVIVCLFVAAFGWSWGPLGWTVPSEIFPLETRSAGQSITVSVNLFFTFAIAQSFLSLLCSFKFGIFLFFAAWITVMTVFVYVFLPETKGVPIEEMVLLWRKHWFWKKLMPPLDSTEA